MNRPIHEYSYVVVDVETTGISAFDRVCEIGMSKIEHGEITDNFESLINPDVTVTNTIFHGIEDWMVKDAPRFGDIADIIADFINGSILIAHSAPFDMRFLRYEFQRLDTDLSHHALCTLKLARKMHPELSSHRLDSMLNEYDIINKQHHRAGSDAESCARLFLHLKHQLEAEGKESMAFLKKWGLPYDHKWCEETIVSENRRCSGPLTRDNLKSPNH